MKTRAPLPAILALPTWTLLSLLTWPLLLIATPGRAGELSFDLIFGEQPEGRRIAQPAWSPDGDRLSYLWDDGAGAALWTLDVPGGEPRRLLRLAELQAEVGTAKLESYLWAPDGRQLLLVAGGDLLLLDGLAAKPDGQGESAGGPPGEGGARLRRLTSTWPAEQDPKFDPHGRFVAFVRDADRATGRHPVLMYHYGGPGSQVVADRWEPRRRGLWHRLMAERGFGVLKVDNRGSAFFGKPGQDLLHRRFGEVNLAAQLAGLDYLATLPWADPARVGLWGGSGGGANTLYCLLNRPGVWRAGAAWAPVTDWRLYDAIWTERYLDHPADNPDGYRLSSPQTYATALADPLLIAHGLADDNVHATNTLQLLHRLTQARRPYAPLLYPDQKHPLTGPPRRHFYEQMTAFFERHLGDGGTV